MSLLKGALFSPQCIAEPLQASLSPFLYQTRTLLSGLFAEPRSPEAPVARPKYRCFSSSKIARQSENDAHPGSDFRQHSNYQTHPSFVRRSPASGQKIATDERKLNWSATIEERSQDFGAAQHAAHQSRQNQLASSYKERKPRNSTLTASEQAAFDQIFSEISSKSCESDEPKDEEGEDLKQDFLDEASAGDEDLPGNPRDQLAAIFEKAIARMRQQDYRPSASGSERNARLNEDSYAKAVKMSSNVTRQATFPQLGHFRRLNLELASLDSNEEADAHLKRASEDHRQLVDSLLEAAKSDLEIWEILEKEVFSLMSQLNLQIKHEEKARKAELRRLKKVAKSSTATTITATPNTDNPTTDTALSKTPTAPSRKSAATESKALNTTTLLTIIQTNYAHHALKALRLFRTLKLSSSYALSLLPRLKSLGPISYVLGVSAPFYNELLFQKWTQYSDVQGLADLMQEMVNQGITPDVATLELLRYVDRSRKRDLQGHSGQAKKSWWGLRPTIEGWARVKVLYSRFREEVGEVARRDMDILREGRVSKLQHTSLAIEEKLGKIGGGPLRKVGVDFGFPRYMPTDWRPPPQMSLPSASLSRPRPESWSLSESESSSPSSLSSVFTNLAARESSPHSPSSRFDTPLNDMDKDKARIVGAERNPHSIERLRHEANGRKASGPLSVSEDAAAAAARRRSSSIRDWE